MMGARMAKISGDPWDRPARLVLVAPLVSRSTGPSVISKISCCKVTQWATAGIFIGTVM